MNIRKIILFLLLVLAVSAVMLWSYRPARPSQHFNVGLSNSLAGATPDMQVAPVPAALKTAVGCASYVGEVARSVEPERHTTRQLLAALQPTLFVSDYVMAAKTTNGLELSKAAIMQAYRQHVSADTSALTSQLEGYGNYSGTLPELYARVRSRGAALPSVEATLRDSGVPIDLESDLLIDCLRFACLQTEVEEMYGPLKNPLDRHEPNPEEASACHQAFTRVFNYRFTNRYALSEATATKLLEELSKLTIAVDSLTPSDVQPPANLH